MKEPTGEPKRARKRKPSPIDQGNQFDLDQELRLTHALEEGPTEIIKKVPVPEQFFDKMLPGGGDLIKKILIGDIGDREPPHPPPTPPSPPTLEEASKTLYKDGPRACLYEYPATREWIRNKLQELGVTNQQQLIRTRTAAELLEAIQDYERALDDGFRVRYPTAYFRSLLK